MQEGRALCTEPCSVPTRVAPWQDRYPYSTTRHALGHTYRHRQARRHRFGRPVGDPHCAAELPAPVRRALEPGLVQHNRMCDARALSPLARDDHFPGNDLHSDGNPRMRDRVDADGQRVAGDHASLPREKGE
jgi:hypothetical protein